MLSWASCSLRTTEVDMGVVDEVMGFIADSSNISVLALIPPVIVILMVAFKLPAIPGLIGGARSRSVHVPQQGSHRKRHGGSRDGKRLIFSATSSTYSITAYLWVMYRKTPLRLFRSCQTCSAQAVCRASWDYIHNHLRNVLRRYHGLHRHDGLDDQRTAQDGKRNRRTGSGNRILMSGC